MLLSLRNTLTPLIELPRARIGQAIDSTVTSPRIVPGSRKYPAKYNKMLAALVEFVEMQRLDGAFDREYVRVPVASPSNSAPPEISA